MGLGLGFLQRDQSFGSQLLEVDRSSLVETAVPVVLEATLDPTFKEVFSTQEPLDVVVSNAVIELREDIQEDLRTNDDELVEVISRRRKCRRIKKRNGQALPQYPV